MNVKEPTFVQMWVMTKKESKKMLQNINQSIKIPFFDRYVAFGSVEGHRDRIFYGCGFKDWKAVDRVCTKIEQMYPNEQMVYCFKQETKNMIKRHEKLHKKENKNA